MPLVPSAGVVSSWLKLLRNSKMPSSKTFESYSLSNELQSSFRRSWRMFLSLMGASEPDSTSSDLNRLCHCRKSAALTDPS